MHTIVNTCHVVHHHTGTASSLWLHKHKTTYNLITCIHTNVIPTHTSQYNHRLPCSVGGWKAIIHSLCKWAHLSDHNVNCDVVWNIWTHTTYTPGWFSLECEKKRKIKVQEKIHTLVSPGMMTNVTFPVVLLISWITPFWDMPSTGMPLILRISSPGLRRPSSSVMLLAATLLMYTGLSPLDELAPPTMLNPRLSFPSRTSMMVYSSGLKGGEQKWNKLFE